MGENNLAVDIATYLSIAMVISGLATAVITLLLNLLVMPFTRIKALSKAAKAGNIVEAVRTNIIYPRGSVNFEKDGTIWGYYEYEYAGKRYKYKGRFSNTPPRTLLLYFKKNPAKADTEDWFGYVKDEWKTIFCVLTVVFFIGVGIWLG